MSALARLMAGENIAVIHNPRMETAMFDLQKRHLVLPVWGEMSPALYDLLLSHEISHALHTPLEGWHKAVSEHGRAFKGFLNVIEDVRIERLIKDKYPGLQRQFSAAYRELLARDFFGLKKHNIKPDSMPLIDRINIVAKCGSMVPVNFTAEEQTYLDRAFAVETFEEAKELAVELFKREIVVIKRKKSAGAGGKSKIDVLQEEFDAIAKRLQELREKGSEGAGDDYDDDEDGEEDDDIIDLGEAPDAPLIREEKDEDAEMEALRKAFSEGRDMPEEDKKAAREAAKKEHEKREEDRFKATSSTQDLNNYDDLAKRMQQLQKEMKEEIAKEDLPKEGSGGAGGGVANVEEPKSLTDEAFRENEDQLIDQDARRTHKFGSDEKILVLDDIPLHHFVVPAHKIHAHLTQHFNGLYSHMHTTYNNAQGLKEFLAREQKVINQLAAEFEMRKNANQYARAGSAKTGAINMKRLHATTLSEDIFQRVMKIPEGKSHGMMMYFDQSGSMMGIYQKTIEQMIILVEFCRRMSIPFDVYGFSDELDSYELYFGDEGKFVHPAEPTPGKVQLNNREGHLKQYIHSGMSAPQYKAALLNLWRLRDGQLRPASEGLNGTPMNQAIALSGMLAKKFKLATKVDVVNVLVLTDGEASDSLGISSSRWGYNTGTARVMYGDKLSHRFKQDFYNRASCTAALTALMSEATGANYLGIYIPSAMQWAKGAVRKYHNVTFFGKHKNNKFSFEKDGFFMTENFGFNAFFIIKPLPRDLDVKLEGVDGSKTANQLAKAFSKAAAGRLQNRAFLSVFATSLATAL